ncbi:MAG: cytochrome c oxidase assembly protein [Alphaproteobacteria bacterium]|nr:cytochrome c oxidase assembly protein [Alphaproteobacteria bacterium]
MTSSAQPEPGTFVPARRDDARNARLGLVLASVFAVMLGLSFAAVPLYRLFCQATGFGGTPLRAEGAAARIGDRRIVVRLDATVDALLPWSFAPERPEIELAIGEQGLVFYRAQNLASAPTAGMATYNVTPLKVGKYFNKLQCFCYERQELKVGESMDMPVAFFVDPALADDPAMADVRTITLSYTYFLSPPEPKASADAGGVGAARAAGGQDEPAREAAIRAN